MSLGCVLGPACRVRSATYFPLTHKRQGSFHLRGKVCVFGGHMQRFSRICTEPRVYLVGCGYDISSLAMHWHSLLLPSVDDRFQFTEKLRDLPPADESFCSGFVLCFVVIIELLRGPSARCQYTQRTDNAVRHLQVQHSARGVEFWPADGPDDHHCSSHHGSALPGWFHQSAVRTA